MSAENREHLVLLNIIAPRRLEDKLLALLGDHGAHMTNYMLGHGTASASYIKRVFGMVAEKRKVFVTCVLTAKGAGDVMDALSDELHFDKPNTGIAFTVPVNKLCY